MTTTFTSKKAQTTVLSVQFRYMCCVPAQLCTFEGTGCQNNGRTSLLPDPPSMRTFVSKTLDVMIVQRVRTRWTPNPGLPGQVLLKYAVRGCRMVADSKTRDAESESHGAVGYCITTRVSSVTTTVVGPSWSSRRRGYHLHVVTIAILIVLTVIRHLLLLPGGDRSEKQRHPPHALAITNIPPPPTKNNMSRTFIVVLSCYIATINI